MKAQVNHFKLTTMAAALFAAYASTALAMEDDEVQQLITPESSVSLGVGHWSDKRMQQGMYDGMSDGGAYGSIDAEVRKRNEATGTWTNLTARNLGLDTAEFGLNYEKQGDWGVGLEYSQTPRQNPYTINTGLRNLGSTRQIVTPVAVGAGNDVLLDMRRDATSLSLFKHLSPSLEFRMTFKNEEKDGNRQWGVRNYPTLGSSAGSYPAFIVEPINSTTQQMDALLSYSSEKLQLTGGYYGSWYSNANKRLDVIGSANGVTEMSLPPDNEAHQGYVQGTYAFTPTTRGTFKAAYTHATQNDPFITTMNNNVASWAPRATVGSSLKGEVNTTELMVGLTAKPMKNLSVVANLNYWDRRDDTPVRIDAVSGATNYRNNPFQNTKTSAKLEGTYRLPDGYSINAGMDYTHQRRDISDEIIKTTELFVPYRSTMSETTYRVALRRSLSESLNGSLGYLYSSRDGSSYDAVSTAVDTPTIKPFYIANRERSTVKLALDWNPMEALGVQFAFADSQDLYPNDGVRVDGISEGNAQLWSVDGTYTLNDKWQINAWYSHDTNKIEQIGPHAVAGEWIANLEDKGDSVGIGAKGEVSSKFNVGANLDWTRTVSKYNQSSATSPLPDIRNRTTRLNLFGTYAVRKNSTVRVDLVREVWNTDDWTWDFRDGSPYSYATEGTRVTNDKNQGSTFAGVRYTYKFQ